MSTSIFGNARKFVITIIIVVAVAITMATTDGPSPAEAIGNKVAPAGNTLMNKMMSQTADDNMFGW